MIICKIWDSEYPWDVRAEKVAAALTAAGHEVHLLARNRTRQPVSEQLPEATVHRLAPWPLVGRALDSAAMFPAFFNPRWARMILGTARRTRSDVILCRDLPLAPAAIRAAARLGIPAVLDMAENYPAMMRSLWECGVQRPADWLIRNPGVVARIERWVLRRIDHVLVVIEESAERLVKLGMDPARITVVGNTPPAARATEALRAHSAPGGPLRLIYLGLLEAPRGILGLLEGIARCETSVHLTIIGEGRERRLFQDRAAAMGLNDRVRFLGGIPNSEALALLGDADVGVVPHVPLECWNTTIPNKLFDYMASGLAVLTSDAVPAARIVSGCGAGEVFRYGDLASLAAALGRLADAGHRARCGAAGRAAVLQSYNWEHDSGRLLAAMLSVHGRNRSGLLRPPDAGGAQPEGVQRQA